MPDYPSISAVCHELVKTPPNGLDAATVADLVGRPYATLMSELSRQPGHKLGADLILPICVATGSPLPVKAMCRALRGAFVPLSQPETTSIQLAYLQNLSITVREFGEFATEAAEDIADNKITREELARLTERANQAIEAVLIMVNVATAHYADNC